MSNFSPKKAVVNSTRRAHNLRTLRLEIPRLRASGNVPSQFSLNDARTMMLRERSHLRFMTIGHLTFQVSTPSRPCRVRQDARLSSSRNTVPSNHRETYASYKPN